ncbi:MAG: hypothetical protein ABJ333_11490, partial [Algoriphagus sp.]
MLQEVDFGRFELASGRIGIGFHYKVGEFIMSAIEPNLSLLYLPVEGKILIKSSKDPDEDIFKYY